jgi:hypothetical protein
MAVFVLALLLCAGTAQAQRIKLLGKPLKPDTLRAPQDSQPQKEHDVKKGDTLWDLSHFYYNDPYKWPTIFDANKSRVKNPHWIYPTQHLIIPGLRGDAVPKPMLTMNRERGLVHSMFYTPTSVDTAGPTVLSSEAERIPLVQPWEWLAAPWIADTAHLGVKALVFKPYDPRDQNDKLTQKFHPHDRLYLTLSGPAAPNDRLLAIRLTTDLHELGWIVEPMAVLQIDSVSGNTAVADITSQFSDLKTGDVAIALPMAPAMPSDKLTEVSGGPIGAIITFLTTHPLESTSDYAFVNMGSAAGLAIGDELLAYLPGRQPSDKHPETLPAEPVARLRVVRVTQNTATARVLSLRNASLAEGLPVRVLRKAP